MNSTQIQMKRIQMSSQTDTTLYSIPGGKVSFLSGISTLLLLGNQLLFHRFSFQRENLKQVCCSHMQIWTWMEINTIGNGLNLPRKVDSFSFGSLYSR